MGFHVKTASLDVYTRQITIIMKQMYSPNSWHNIMQPKLQYQHHVQWAWCWYTSDSIQFLKTNKLIWQSLNAGQPGWADSTIHSQFSAQLTVSSRHNSVSSQHNSQSVLGRTHSQLSAQFTVSSQHNSHCLSLHNTFCTLKHALIVFKKLTLLIFYQNYLQHYISYAPIVNN